MGMLIIICLHLIINLFAVSLSFYLSFMLTKRFTEGNDAKSNNYTIILVIIIGGSLISSVLGKIFSSKIFMAISKNMHNAVVKSMINSKIDYFE